MTAKEVCEEHGHNYYQLHGEKGAIPTLVCSKCGDVRQVQEKAAY
jgi:hypothetical protein